MRGDLCRQGTVIAHSVLCVPRVAHAYDVRLEDLLKWNNVRSITGFYEGQTVNVSAPKA